MTSMWQPGQLLYAGFQGHKISKQFATLISQGRIGGIILFARNIVNPKQLIKLIQELQTYAPPQAPLLFAIDQEGGPVQRLKDPWTEWPAMRQFGVRNRLDDTKAFATALAQELKDVGIGLNFAPVVDVDSNPQNPVIGERSFASDPKIVARHGAAFITALQQARVAGCAKHFPGHGDTYTDSHYVLPQIDHPLPRLREIELPPFQAAIVAGVASIMTAHILLPQIDRKRPATLSPSVINLLREDLSYDGVVFSDDLEMRAIADHFSVEQRVYGCLEAKVDALLVCNDESLVVEALRLLEKAPDNLIEHALRRIIKLKHLYAKIVPIDNHEQIQEVTKHQPKLPPPYPEHQILAKRLFSAKVEQEELQ